MSQVPQITLDETPTQYSSPMVSSKRAREYQDNESDDDSYGSLLTTGTVASTMTTEEEMPFNEPPSEYMYPSYAAAAMASNTSMGDTQISSPTNSTYPDWQKEKQELEAQIRNQALQIEKIQADLDARITRSKDLEDQLARAIDLAHSRDARHEEMLAKVELLMKTHAIGHHENQPMQDTAVSTQVQASPSTPERQLVNIDAPPPKKANTNTSPNRTIYALFRQTQHKQTTTRQNNRTSISKRTSQQASEQPMETDA